MVAGVALDAAEEACGIKRMPTRRLLEALQHFGIRNSGRFKPVARGNLMQSADIVRVKWLNNGRYHYAVTAGDGAFFCPSLGRIDSFDGSARVLSVLWCDRP